MMLPLGFNIQSLLFLIVVRTFIDQVHLVNVWNHVVSLLPSLYHDTGVILPGLLFRNSFVRVEREQVIK